MDVFPEELRPQDGFQKVDAVPHSQRGLALVVKGKEEAGIYKLKGLDKGAAGFVIINGIHLRDKDIRIFRQGFPGFLFGDPAGNLAAQVHDSNAGNFMEHAGFDVIVKGLSQMPSSGWLVTI